MSIDFFESILMALSSIVSNKMRSFLTMLGVIIGVASVISLVSVGTGAAIDVSKQIESMGSNLITVTLKGRAGGPTLTQEECMSLVNKQGIAAVAPTISGSASIKNNEKTINTNLEGITPEYASVRNYRVQSGRFIKQADVDIGQQVVLLGVTVSKKLFSSKDPVGSTVKINGYEFKVIGLLEEKGGNAYGSNDDKILVPITTAQKTINTRVIKNIYVNAATPGTVKLAVLELKNYLLKKFRDENSFTVVNQQDTLSALDSVTDTLTFLLSAIAGISLIVGGIGIMNIMLVSVTERTREIGIRKAVGARRRDVMFQFLIEAMTLSGTGGLLGIGLGIAISDLIGSTMKVSTAVSPDIILFSFLFSLIVGVLFGLYPANKASKLNPIDALRFE